MSENIAYILWLSSAGFAVCSMPLFTLAFILDEKRKGRLSLLQAIVAAAYKAAEKIVAAISTLVVTIYLQSGWHGLINAAVSHPYSAGTISAALFYGLAISIIKLGGVKADMRRHERR